MAKTLTTLLAALWLTATLAACASASLYCTSPVASTVWTAGRSQTISWTDDKAPPRLAAYGALDIELLSGADDENPVATLARGVDASARSCSAWVSPAWGPNGSDYYLRFRSASGRAAYTASFTVLGMAALAPAAPASASNGTDAADALFTPYLTLVLPNTTTVSALAPQRTSARPAASAPPVSASDEDAYLHAHGGGATSGAGGAGALGRHIDFERLKFRLVFIIWPALVGITMAM